MISSPVSTARAASAAFHARGAVAVGAPASAVISGRRAGSRPGRPRPAQRRRQATANAAVLWSMPTATRPVFAVRS